MGIRLRGKSGSGRERSQAEGAAGTEAGDGKVLVLPLRAHDAQGEDTAGASPSEDALRPTVPGVGSTRRGPGSPLRCPGLQLARRPPPGVAGRTPGPGSGCGGTRGVGRPVRPPGEERKAAPLGPTQPGGQTLRGQTSAPGCQGQAGNVVSASVVSSCPIPTSVLLESWWGAAAFPWQVGVEVRVGEDPVTLSSR